MSRAVGKGRPTLSDVARTAGVAVGTVSMVLSGKGDLNRISEETQRRVQEVAAELRYSPSLLHRSVRGGKTGIIALYSGFRTREPDDQYLNRLSAAIEAAGGRNEYNILVYCNYRQSARETFDFLVGGFVDGLIMVGAQVDDPLTTLLRESSLPTVVIDPGNLEPTLSSIRTDDGPGIAALAADLVRCGHQRVAGVIPVDPKFIMGHHRYDKLRKEMMRLGVAVPDVRLMFDDHGSRHVIEQVMTMEHQPTALFAWQDWLAYDLLEACTERGVSVPESLSIVGYDGIVRPSKTNRVVSSVCSPPERFAEFAIDTLVRLIQGEPGPLQAFVVTSYAAGDTLGHPAP